MNASAKSYWNKWLAAKGHVRLVVIEATQLMSVLNAKQGLKDIAQAGYAEAIVGSLLIASHHKENESINMNAQGSGPFKQAIVDASPEGRVRGFLIEQKDPDMHTFGAEGHNGPWGSGVLSILYTKNFEGKHPYRGIVAISTGYLDEAINEYYRDSEQLTSKVGLYIEFDGPSLKVVRGAMVQTLGGATDEELKAVSSLSVKDLRAMAEIAHDSDKVVAMAEDKLGMKPFRLVEHKDLIDFCNCDQDRIERALVLTGEEDALYALGEDPYISITCDFCRTEYKVSRERLKDLFGKDPSRLQ